MPRKDNHNFLAAIPLWLWVAACMAIILLCCLPILLVQPGFIDFTQTGQIGDTIGGTMGPFVAIVAAILTFVAFWVQYQANIKQREDIAIERIEGKYYKMLDIYSSMVNSLSVHGVQGKAAFAELVGEFTYTYYMLDKIYCEVIEHPLYLVQASDQLKKLISAFRKESERRKEFLTNLAYNLFFYGKNYTVVDLKHPELTELAEAIKTEGFKRNVQLGRILFSDYVKSGNFDIKHVKGGMISSLYEGHSDFLGHYFRHLFQTVKYIASIDDNLLSEDKKYEYVKLLRMQMSDYEQILLYYNSLTEQGRAWNVKRGDEFPSGVGYISRFRLIKNLPPNFPVFGVYHHEKYSDDIKKWEGLGKSFYEHKFMPIAVREIDK